MDFHASLILPGCSLPKTRVPGCSWIQGWGQSVSWLSGEACRLVGSEQLCISVRMAGTVTDLCFWVVSWHCFLPRHHACLSQQLACSPLLEALGNAVFIGWMLGVAFHQVQVGDWSSGIGILPSPLL